MTFGEAKIRGGWPVGLDVLARAIRKAGLRITAHSRGGVESKGEQSQAYVSSRRPSLQRSAPVMSIKPSADRNAVRSPLDGFDIATFMRELDALRRCMNDVAFAFDQAREKYGATVMAGEQRRASAVDLAAMNDALARAVTRLGKSRY
jgi:hypothetical protein